MRGSRVLWLVAILVAGAALWATLPDSRMDTQAAADPRPAIAADEAATPVARHKPATLDEAAGSIAPADGPIAAEPSAPGPAYAHDRIMVRAHAGWSLEAVAARHGSRVIRPAGPSGYATMAVPTGMERDAYVVQVLLDDGVADADRIGRIYGADAMAGSGALSSSNDVLDYQWHIDASDRPASTAVDDGSLSSIKVAVLDTGLAYEDHDDGVGLPSFNQVGISDPWDFVNGDDKPYDDPQHGSHIASVIASFTEDGDEGPCGIAPGVNVMPVKVLDGDNAGYETYLLDALAWTVEKDAQIVNMSLSFGEGYVISAALDQALHDVDDAGIVMVAAAGNQGASFVSYPAAHRDVIAVGAARLHNNNKMKVPSYSNTHPRVDLLGSGGDISFDKNNDGVVDGVLGETIALQDPDTAAYVLYAGTSQATAVVSAAAAWLLADDVHPAAVRHVLQRTAKKPKGGGDPLEKGAGTGYVQIDAALAAVTSADRSGGPDDDVFVAVMPYIEWVDDEAIKPKAEITVLDGSGSPIADAEVVGSFTGSTAKFKACTTDGDGVCTLKGKLLDDYSEASDPGDLAWAIEVPTVVVDGIVHHPRTAFFASDALEILLAAIEAEPELGDGLIGFHWPGGVNEYGDLLESYFLVDLGVGLGGTPLGIIVPRRTFGDADATIDVDLDGTGLGGTPLGIVPIPRFDFDGTGLGGTPLGGRIIILGGGLGGTPLGFRPPGFFGGGLGGTPLGFHDSPFLHLDGHSVRLGNDWTCGTGLGGTALGTILDRGGWTVNGYGGASALVGSGDVAITAASIEGMIGSGDLLDVEFEDIVVCQGDDCGDD